MVLPQFTRDILSLRRLVRALFHPREDLSSIEPDGFPLVVLSGVDIRDGGAAFKQFVDGGCMFGGITADRPFGHNLIKGNFPFGPFLNLGRIVEVVEVVESFGQKTPQCRPLLFSIPPCCAMWTALVLQGEKARRNEPAREVNRNERAAGRARGA